MTRVPHRPKLAATMRIVLILLVMASTAAAAAYQAPFAHIPMSSTISVESALGSRILSKARRLQEEEDFDDQAPQQQDIDLSFVANYNIKFQGCHHISQWNENADEEDEVRIKKKRLIRFRLCPASSCSSTSADGCRSNYGDYVVDMETFVEAYLEEAQQQRKYQCRQVDYLCNDACGENDDNPNCMFGCYANKQQTACYYLAYGEGKYIEPVDYALCAQYEFQYYAAITDDADNRRRLDDEEYYIGPYCADQGGEIKFGLFYDDTCTTFVNRGNQLFASREGYELPFAYDSLVSYDCISCEYQQYSDDDVVQDAQAANNNAANGFCEAIYSLSGKCEKKMNVNYQNNAACTYIEGVKIVQNNGIIRKNTRESTLASLVIGSCTTIAILLGAYVCYLQKKLGNAKVDLASQG